ncbi:MAG: DUF4124 domain-containing protein [Pseudomonadota bacterium]
MKRHAAISTFFFVALLSGSGASATSGINKCVAEDGQVTLTDELCPADTRTVQEATDNAPAAQPTVLARHVEHYALPPKPLRLTKPVRGLAPARGLALDVATLKTARANLMLFDSSRSQRLAGLP